MFCFAETNVMWSELHSQDRMRERTKGWFENININMAYYHEYPIKKKFQAGGTVVWCLNEAASRSMNSGKDELGRWAWTRLTGKEGKVLRILSAYRPVPNKSGPGSVW